MSHLSQTKYRRHCALYIDREGKTAIAVALHYNGAGGVLVEDESPIVLTGDLVESDLARAVEEILGRSMIREEKNLSNRRKSEWPSYMASRQSSVSQFENSYIRLSIRGANDANLVFEIEGLPAPDSDLRVLASISSASSGLGGLCLSVWRACRDRKI